MSSAATQPTPVVPPRPSRSQDKSNGTRTSPPTVPPRPASLRRFNRSVSPNPDRFAPSPLNEVPFSPKGPLNSDHHTSGHSASRLGEELNRPNSVGLPGPGEEGQEYAIIEDLSSSTEPSRRDSSSPEQTRTVGEDIKLHAPKPTMPAQSAKQRVAIVTRTDSDRAASFGIGRPSSTEQHASNQTLKKKASIASQLSQVDVEDGHGIPEIGQRVPMYPNAGDVQAPSPAPVNVPSESTKPSRSNHSRKSSSRGFNELPPGSYGLHGHGVASTDKLEKSYYEKHPELLHKEHYSYLHDRPNNFSLSSEDLNKIVRDTASRSAGLGASHEYTGTPSEQVGFQATEEYAARLSRPPSAAPKDIKSPGKPTFTGPDVPVQGDASDEDDDVIHVEDYGHHRGYVNFGDEQSAMGEGADDEYIAPILAPDEVAKGTALHELHPAVEPPPERRGSAFEMDQPRSRSTSRPASRPASRPTSRPTSIYSPPELQSTPLEDVKEYEPLFTDDEKSGKQPITTERLKEIRQRFPSRDIWEDAPNSVHATAEVSTPEVSEALPKPQVPIMTIPPRDNETPAQAFARRQEELAEKEAVNPDSFLHRQQKPQAYVKQRPHITKENQARPTAVQRFPSRDVWEDTPDSLQFTTTVSGPQSDKDLLPEEEGKPDVPTTTLPSKPAIPARPKKQSSGDDASSKPAIPERPKPQIPARPSMNTFEPKQLESPPRSKPVVPVPVPGRAGGGKIAALQAGFMTDLNKRLQLGPQAPKKDEPAAAADLVEANEKVPLSDARKGRARGPQRRAPTRNTAAPTTSAKQSTPPPASSGKPVLSFSMTRTLFSIDEEGTITVEEEPMTSVDEESKAIKSVTSAIKDIEPEEPTSGSITGLAKEESTEERETVPEAKDAELADQPTEKEKPSDEVPEENTKEEDAEEETTPETEETKTVVANTAGEPILEETIEKKPGDQVEEVESTKDEVVDRT